jgi:hypothetical protein
MNIKNSFYSIIALILIFFTGCSPRITTNTTKTLDIYGAGVIQYPVIAELNVSENQITGRASANDGESLEVVKKNALIDALNKSNADILVEPVYKTIRQGRRATAEVSGFPATYVNFRSATEQDIRLIEAGILQTASTIESPEIVEENSGRRNGIIATMTLLGLTGLAILLNNE